MAWLLDTNILSELRKPRPAAKAEVFIASQPLDQLYISVVTLAEIRFGIERVGDANRRAELGTWLTNNVRPDLIIAATAVHHGFTVISRDRKDYDKARVPVINPWEPVAEKVLQSLSGKAQRPHGFGFQIFAGYVRDKSADRTAGELAGVVLMADDEASISSGVKVGHRDAPGLIRGLFL